MILDASALLASIADPKVAGLLRGQDLTAPELLIAECLNARWKLRRSGHEVPERSVLLGLLDQIRIVPSRANAARAAELAEQLDHPVYDCLYYALAEAESDVLITADAAFERKARAIGPRGRVRLVHPKSKGNAT